MTRRSGRLAVLEKMQPEHAVARINDGWYVCDVCGQTGSERWAILHQFPARKPL